MKAEQPANQFVSSTSQSNDENSTLKADNLAITFSGLIRDRFGRKGERGRGHCDDEVRLSSFKDVRTTGASNEELHYFDV